MAEISFVRVDTRLIHGQIVTKWIKYANANKIMVIDDLVSKDPFMVSVYKMSIPNETKIAVKNVDDAYEAWCKNEYGKGKVMLILKDIDTIYRFYKKGFPLTELNIGNLVSSSDKISITKEVYLSNTEYIQLKEMNDNGIRVFIQITPEVQETEFNTIENTFSK